MEETNMDEKSKYIILATNEEEQTNGVLTEDTVNFAGVARSKVSSTSV